MIPGLRMSTEEGIRLLTPVFLGFPCGSAGKESARNVGNLGSIPGLGRSPGEEKGYLLPYSDLENSMDSIVYCPSNIGETVGGNMPCMYFLKIILFPANPWPILCLGSCKWIVKSLKLIV